MRAEKVENEKPVANIAALNINVTCGNFRTSTCGSNLIQRACVAPT